MSGTSKHIYFEDIEKLFYTAMEKLDYKYDLVNIGERME